MNMHPDLGFFDEGMDFVEPKFYSAAQKPFGLAEVLPPAAFRSKIFADLEDEKVWTRAWVCIGTEQQIPDTKDLLPFTLGNHGIHVQRTTDGSLIGRFNKAQHGGCRAIPAQCQTGTKTKCSFTSCGYSRDRNVIYGTEVGEDSRLAGQYLGDRPERLYPVHVESWGPLIFANIDQECTPLAKQFIGLARNLIPYFEGGLKQVAEWRLEHRSNWKLVGRACLEELELPFSNETITKVPAKRPSSYIERLFFLNSDYENHFESLPMLSGIPRAAQRRASLHWLFPNLLLALMPDHVLCVILQPTGTCLTLQRVILFAHESVKAKATVADLTELNGFWDSALNDSAARAEARQEEINSWCATTKRFPNEDSTFGYAFQKLLIDRILTKHDYHWLVPLYSQPGR